MPSAESIGGALLAAVGLGCLTIGDGFGLNLGDLLVLGCAFAFAGQIVLMGKYAARSSTYELVVGQMLAVALWSWFFTLLWEEPTFQATPRTWAAMAVTGILASAVAFCSSHYAAVHQSHPHGHHLRGGTSVCRLIRLLLAPRDFDAKAAGRMRPDSFGGCSSPNCGAEGKTKQGRRRPCRQKDLA